MNKLIFFYICFFFIYNTSLNALVESEVFPELVYRSALKEGNIDVIRQHLDLGHSSTKLDGKKLSPMAYAVKNESIVMMELLLKYKANINGEFLDKITPLTYSVLLEKDKLIEFLIKNGSDINHQDNIGRTALMIAIERENITIVQKLLEYKPDLSQTDFSGKDIYDYIQYIRKPQLKELFK